MLIKCMGKLFACFPSVFSEREGIVKNGIPLDRNLPYPMLHLNRTWCFSSYMTGTYSKLNSDLSMSPFSDVLHCNIERDKKD